MKPVVHVAITGAAGQVGYALIFRIAAGDMLGLDQPMVLHLLETPQAVGALEGVRMELEDCAFPLLHGVFCTSDADEAFTDADYAILVGSKPRKEGMERADLLLENAAIFAPQGQALNRVAQRHVKVLVVGNPANTNALIAMRNAPDLSPQQFTAMTRLDHNRAKAQLAGTLHCWAGDIQRMTIWGNHSPTQYPDVTHCLLHGESICPLLPKDWIENVFMPSVRQRAVEIIRARGLSSAASAASAAIDHMHDWVFGSPPGDWVSMGVFSSGDYGIDDEICYSLPCTCENGAFKVVSGIELSEGQMEKINHSLQELQGERDAVAHLLPALSP